MVKYVDGLDAVAAALAHPGRRHVVDRLRAGPATTTELAAVLGVGLPAAVKHLGLLSTAELLRSQKTGRTVRHELEPARLRDYSTWLLMRRSFWTGQLAELAAHLEES